MSGAPRPRLGLGLVGLLLRSAPTRGLMLAVLVVLATAGLVLVPTWFTGRTAEAFAESVAGEGPGTLGLEFSQGGSIEPLPSDPLGGLARQGEAIAASLPPAVAAITGPRTDLVDTQEYQAVDEPVKITRVALRFMPDAATMTRFVEGVAPTGAETEQQVGQLRDQDGNPMMAQTYEAAVSRETADELGLHVGTHLSMILGAAINGQALGITVTGIFEPVDPADPRWFGDATLLSPVEVRASMETTIYHMVALLSDDAYPAFVPPSGFWGGSQSQMRYRWRFPVSAAGASSWPVDAIAAGLSKLAVAYPYRGSMPVNTPGLSTGLGRAISAYQDQRAVATTAFWLAAAGPLAAGVGILALAAVAVAERRRGTLRVLRARGTGGLRLGVAEALAAVALVVPAAVVGVLAAAALASAGGSAPGAPILGAAIATSASAFGLLLLAALGTLRSPVGAPVSRRAARLLSRSRARVLMGLVVVVAAAAAIGLRSASHPAGAPPGAAQALVPVLLAVAGGLVLARAFNLVVRGVARAAGRGRGFAPVHTLRGLARDAGGQNLAFAVLTVAVTAGVFAGVVTGSLTRSQDVAAANRVGADYRIAAVSLGGLPTGLDTGRLAAIGPTAVLGAGGGTLSSRTLASTFISTTVVDPAAYARVVAGSLVDPSLARALEVDRPSTDTGPGVPLVLRASFATRNSLAPGMQLTFTLAGQSMVGVVVAVLADLPGVPPTSDVVVPSGALDPRAAAAAVPMVVLLQAGPDTAPVEAVIAPYRSQLDVQTREAVLHALAGTPMASAMRDGFAVTIALASLLAGVVVAASLLAALGSRVREAAILRALGVVDGSARRIVVGEAALTVLVALATGLALGLAVAWLTVPDLGLERMAGIATAVVPVVDPVWVVAALAGPVLLGPAALVVGLALARRATASARLLAGEL